MTARRPRLRLRHRLALLWNDILWPVLAGAVAATGLLGTVEVYGVLGGSALLLGLWAMVALLVYGVAAESGLGRQLSVRIGLGAAFWTVVLFGLVWLFPLGGWLLGLGIGLTAPVVTGWAGRQLQRVRVVRWLTRAALVGPDDGRGQRSQRDQADVDRRFSALIADLEQGRRRRPDRP